LAGKFQKKKLSEESLENGFPSLGIIATKRRKITRALAQVARAPIGAMETPDTTF
jgi:hypothetical protein